MWLTGDRIWTVLFRKQWLLTFRLKKEYALTLCYKGLLMFTFEKVRIWPLKTTAYRLCVHMKDAALRVPGQFFVVFGVWLINHWFHLMQLCVQSDTALCCIIYFPPTKSHCPGVPMRPCKCACMLLKELLFFFLVPFLLLAICLTLLFAFCAYRTSQAIALHAIQLFLSPSFSFQSHSAAEPGKNVQRW